ncbi:MAG: rod shape-determining protein MreD [Bacteroidaceae bacterium]|nr:rod shape-determining protein MreD [Bacteroidaceae bacterium]
MVITFLQRMLWMVALVAAQMMVFNYMHLFGYATPLPFIYFLLLFPRGTQRWSILLWGFICGLLCDVVSLTPGIGAASMTLIAFVQPLFLEHMVPKDAVDDLQPGIDTMGFWSYVRYAGLLTFLFSLCYFLVLSFNFFHIVDLGLSFVSSWLLTLLLCLSFEGVRSKRNG